MGDIEVGMKYILGQIQYKQVDFIIQNKMRVSNPRMSIKSIVDEEQLYQKVKKVIEKNKQADLFHKAFLKPIELELRTWQTQKDYDNIGALPYGVKQVLKDNISMNKYETDDIRAFSDLHQKQKQNYQFICENNYDNLLSLIKPQAEEGQFKLAICICMYSEDKTMLKRTIKGVADNIATFVKNGVPSDQIGVFVIMDGIQVVDETVVQFFTEMEKQNGIYLDDDVDPSGPKDIVKTEMDQLEEGEVINVNNFIFNGPEFQDRKNRRFSARKKEYKEIKEMLEQISKMQKDRTITLQTMNQWLLPYFIKCAKDDHKNQYGADDLQIADIKDSFYIQEYGNTISKSRPLIRKALQDARRYCEQYRNLRQNLVLLSSFRYEIDLNMNEQLQEGMKSKEKYIQANRDQEQVGQTVTKMNLFMLTKYKNRGKLSSHNWFFNGICKQFKPQYAVLLDVGLAPEKDALYKMVRHMENDRDVGGVCGYMGLRIQRLQDKEQEEAENVDFISRIFLKFVDIQRAQQLQYHFAHLVDKPFESMFKFIHVLPGAFSAYRMQAIFPGSFDEDSRVIKQYFKSLQVKNDALIKKSDFSTGQTIMKVILPDFLYSCFNKDRDQNSQEQLLYDENVYLAEDRTLCMGIHENNYNLEYLPDAYAWVDPIKTLSGLLGQRKRWINGSFFAFDKVKQALTQNSAGQCCLNLQIVFLTFLNILAFVSPALFMFTVHIAMILFKVTVISGSFISNYLTGEGGIFLIYTVDFIYLMSFLALIFFSMHLTNRNQKFVPYIYAVATLLGILSIMIFVLLAFEIFSVTEAILFLNSKQLIDQLAATPQQAIDLINSLKWIIVAIFFLYGFPIILFCILYKRCSFLVDIVFSVISFMFYGPTYLNILNIYALCRIDDISWGTKGLDSEMGASKKARQESWKKIKLLHVCKFVFWNIVVAFILLSAGGQSIPRFYVTYIIMIILGFTLVLKIFLGVLYLLKYKCQSEQVTGSKHPDPSHQHINLSFEKVKKSLYKDLRSQIKGVQEDCKEQNIPISNAVAKGGSKVHQIGRKRAQNKFKQMNNEKLSKIQKKTEKSQRFRAAKKQSMIRQKDEKKQLQAINESPERMSSPEKPNEALNKTSDNLLESDFKKTQTQQEDKSKKKKTFARQKPIVTK